MQFLKYSKKDEMPKHPGDHVASNQAHESDDRGEESIF
jgi:hypothetical protein